MALFVLYQCLLLDRLHIYEKFYLKGQPPFHLDVARKDLVITSYCIIILYEERS